MNTLLQLDARDRVLVLAPHPDDESLASGGLLQLAQEVGAAKRVLLVTDGDNNPWPQRWSERRWRIGPAERLRWGLRRRAEAGSALSILGLAENEVKFLGLPDLGITSLLLRADASLRAKLRTEIEQFEPTLIIAPAMADRHPDHSALHVGLRTALLGSVAPQILSYRTHGTSAVTNSRQVHLNLRQQQVKRNAIAAHASQMILSRKRFLGYAQACEFFIDEAELESDAPIKAQYAAGTLRVRVNLELWRWRLRDCALYLVLETSRGESLRWGMVLPSSSRSCELRDLANERLRQTVYVQVKNGMASMSIALGDTELLAEAYAKVEITGKNLFVFDRAGWYRLLVASKETAPHLRAGAMEPVS